MNEESGRPARVGFLIVGNEILSGRTREGNLAVLAEMLNARGARLAEARVVRDEPDAIVFALNEMRRAHDFVLTSGGIGPTHDDITTEAVAKALGVAAEENPQALAKMRREYAKRDLELTPARRRMALAPLGAKPLAAAVPGAPGYRAENVFVCAGVPWIFEKMAAAAVAEIPAGKPRRSRTIRVEAAEGFFAAALGEAQARHPAVEIGSYPRDDGGVLYCNIVFAGDDPERINRAAEDFSAWLRAEKIEHSEG